MQTIALTQCVYQIQDAKLSLLQKYNVILKISKWVT